MTIDLHGRARPSLRFTFMFVTLLAAVGCRETGSSHGPWRGERVARGFAMPELGDRD